MPPVSPGWALRLTALLGAPPNEVNESHLRALVTGQVREDADLDYKQQRYASSANRDLAGDIAAMANARGGIIVIGIRDTKDVAAELTPVELADGEEARIRQIAASNIAPHLEFDVREVECAEDPAKGYYLLVIPPSTMAPHAVRRDRDLRYPRRDGTTTRWLSEAEVADAYRDRFRLAETQTARASQVLDEGFATFAVEDEPVLGVAVVPTGGGSMPIDLARVRAVEQWAKDQGPARFFEGFFDRSSPPSAGVGARRVTLKSIYERNDAAPTRQYVELYDDGAGFAARRLTDLRRLWNSGGERLGMWIVNEVLLYELARSLNLLGRHAAENCGAWGDALVEVRVAGDEMTFAFLDQFGHPEALEGGRTLTGGVETAHTVTIDVSHLAANRCSLPRGSSRWTCSTPSGPPRSGT